MGMSDVKPSRLITIMRLRLGQLGHKLFVERGEAVHHRQHRQAQGDRDRRERRSQLVARRVAERVFEESHASGRGGGLVRSGRCPLYPTFDACQP